MAIDIIGTQRPGSNAAPALSGPSGLSGALPAAGGFGESLGKLLASVDSSAGAANTAVANMVDGSGDVHTAMIALQRAEQTLELTVQVRNKLVQAYQDVMRMPI
jgi:flagellar hook-basal body complex protein FliE